MKKLVDKITKSFGRRTKAIVTLNTPIGVGSEFKIVLFKNRGVLDYYIVDSQGNDYYIHPTKKKLEFAGQN